MDLLNAKMKDLGEKTKDVIDTAQIKGLYAKDKLDEVASEAKGNINVAKENLRLREKPDLQAATGGFNYKTYFGTAESFLTGRYTYKGYKVNSFTDYPLLLKGMTVQYEAVTVNQQTIDGIKAPWYRIILKDNSEEGAWPQRFWVFGGYLSEIENPKNPEYEEQLIQSAIEKGILEKE